MLNCSFFLKVYYGTNVILLNYFGKQKMYEGISEGPHSTTMAG